jgi:hypothetical protein
MEFSKYYKQILDTTGIPKLSLEQHKRLFNIIHFEGQLERIKHELNQFGHNTVTVHNKEKILSKLNQLYNAHTHPASVFSEMLAKSREAQNR